MPINPDAVGNRGETSRFAWTSKDTILYALGVGCGREDLPFVTENSIDTPQCVLPTYAVIIGTRGVRYNSLGENLDLSKLVHGNQSFELFGQIAPSGEVEATATIAGIWDKGSAAVVDIETDCRDVTSGELLMTVRHSLFFRGEGGWGGDRGPAAAVEYPDRPADARVTYQTREDQALIYRLSGDRNPLHSDPAYARMGGFDQPILHGLCTYGFTGRALLAELAGGESERFKAMSGRFSRPVYPGEALTVEIWRNPGGGVFRTLNGKGEVVLDHGTATIT